MPYTFRKPWCGSEPSIVRNSNYKSKPKTTSKPLCSSESTILRKPSSDSEPLKKRTPR